MGNKTSFKDWVYAFYERSPGSIIGTIMFPWWNWEWCWSTELGLTSKQAALDVTQNIKAKIQKLIQALTHLLIMLKIIEYILNIVERNAKTFNSCLSFYSFISDSYTCKWRNLIIIVERFIYFKKILNFL